MLCRHHVRRWHQWQRRSHAPPPLLSSSSSISRGGVLAACLAVATCGGAVGGDGSLCHVRRRHHGSGTLLRRCRFRRRGHAVRCVVLCQQVPFALRLRAAQLHYIWRRFRWRRHAVWCVQRRQQNAERHPLSRWDNTGGECSYAVDTFRGFCPWQCPRLKKERRLPGHVDATQWIDVRWTTAQRRRSSRGVRSCITICYSLVGLVYLHYSDVHYIDAQ